MIGEEGTMGQHNVHCHEIVGVLLGRIGLKLGKAAIGVNSHDRNYVLKDLLQTEYS